jgi:hypothetical protein
VGRRDGEIQCVRHAPGKTGEQHVRRAAAVVRGMVNIGNKQVQWLYLGGYTCTVTDVREEVAQSMMTAGSVPTAITHKRVVPFTIHCSATKGTEHPAREDIDAQAALQFNDKLLRLHGKPKDSRRSRVKEVPCAGRRLGEKLGAIALVARSKIIVEGGNVKPPGQRLLRTHQAVPQSQGIRRRTGIVVDGQRARELSILRGVARVFSHALGSRLR